MAEESEQPTRRRTLTKGRLESLSDLIFGLALSIGALTLIGTAPKNFNSLLLSLAYFAFSFLILIGVWRSYTSTMSNLHGITPLVINLNVLLLFLVSIEPFLFNEFNAANISTQYVSTIYAVDLGGLFAIQAFLANCVLAEVSLRREMYGDFRHSRNSEVISAAFFFVSTLPIFWTLKIPITASVDVPVRFFLWFAPWILHPLQRFFEKREDASIREKTRTL